MGRKNIGHYYLGEDGSNGAIIIAPDQPTYVAYDDPATPGRLQYRILRQRRSTAALLFLYTAVTLILHLVWNGQPMLRIDPIFYDKVWRLLIHENWAVPAFWCYRFLPLILVPVALWFPIPSLILCPYALAEMVICGYSIRHSFKMPGLKGHLFDIRPNMDFFSDPRAAIILGVIFIIMMTILIVKTWTIGLLKSDLRAIKHELAEQQRLGQDTIVNKKESG